MRNDKKNVNISLPGNICLKSAEDAWEALAKREGYIFIVFEQDGFFIKRDSELDKGEWHKMTDDKRVVRVLLDSDVKGESEKNIPVHIFLNLPGDDGERTDKVDEWIGRINGIKLDEVAFLYCHDNRSVFMPKITLHKALKVKSRLSCRLVYVETLIGGCGIGHEESDDVQGLLIRRDKLADALVALRAAISEANLGQRRSLYEMDSLLRSIAFFKGLNTICLKRGELMDKVRRLEVRLDALQEEVDAYNATTKVDVGQDVLDLVK